MSSWRSWDDDYLPADICADLDESCGCGHRDRSGDSGCSGRGSGWSGGCGSESGHGHRYGRERDCSHSSGHGKHESSSCGCGCGGHGHCRRHRRRAIPVGNITVDCRPVTFRTPGQAMNIVSCPVSRTVLQTVTQQVNCRFTLPNGQIGCIPLTQTVQVPCVETIQTPPLQTPTAIFLPDCGCGC